ncbi:hypothetical protein EJ08DRAFT_707888 [Tothia fuscella]|uniref:Uncharacterized protein n=1 Tax=Tothia fuscella TaxID=1048955 RepID=A0A9P4NYG4_9PEZI|nr:hypothetical protein EJ08DRAFT_707888 [Tothia fuscella]
MEQIEDLMKATSVVEDGNLNGTHRSRNMKTFYDLHADILHCIFRFLQTKEGQRSCTFLDRRTRGILLPDLYNHIILEFGKPFLLSTAGLMDPLNPGLVHVHELSVWPLEFGSSEKPHHEGHMTSPKDVLSSFTTECVLQSLPTDPLDVFRLGNLLRTRQRRLREMELPLSIHNLNDSAVSGLPPLDATQNQAILKAMTQLRYLTVRTFNFGMLADIFFALNMRQITGLTLDMSDYEYQFSYDTYQPHDLFRGHWELDVNLARANAFSVTPAMGLKWQLKILKLVDVDLGMHDEFLVRNLSLPMLEMIKLRYCPGTISSFARLKASRNWKSAIDTPAHHQMRHSEWLQYLVIDVKPSSPAIEKLSSSRNSVLTKLYNIRNADLIYRFVSSFDGWGEKLGGETLFDTFNLKTLGLALHFKPLDDDEREFNLRQLTDLYQFMSSVVCNNKLLFVLHIFNLSELQSRFYYAKLPSRCMNVLLADEVSRIYRERDSNLPDLITFGLNDGVFCRDNPIYFRREIYHSARGKREVCASCTSFGELIMEDFCMDDLVDRVDFDDRIRRRFHGYSL